jgi:hypothetical protein
MVFSQGIDKKHNKLRANSYINLMFNPIDFKQGQGRRDGCTETDRFVRNRTLVVFSREGTYKQQMPVMGKKHTKKGAPLRAPFPTIYNHKTNSQLTKLFNWFKHLCSLQK